MKGAVLACSCSRKVTVTKAGRRMEKVVAKVTCMICRGAGMTVSCPVCNGAGLKAGATFNEPKRCEECNGAGRVPWKA
jgi:hypothetical protein